MKNRFTGFSLILALMVAVTPGYGQSAKQDSALNEDIIEAVFRYQMTHCSEKRSDLIFLLSNNGKDFSDEFMKRFKADGARVGKGSARADSEATHEFIDQQSGKLAVLLTVNKLKIAEDDKAEVEASCGFASWAATGYKYFLAKEKTQWLVKHKDPTWVW